MTVQAAGRTETGHIRSRNEDCLLEDVDRRLFAVADGLGGHPAGDVASRVAIDALDDLLTAERLEDDGLKILPAALEEAALRVREAAAADPSRHGMGTTAVVAHVREDDGAAVTAHVGDSRAYVLAGDRLRRVTRDHVRSGLFGRTLMQALGTDVGVDPEATEIDMAPGDRLLLCTDGLTDMVDDGHIEQILAGEGSVDAICDRLVQEALDRGGADNVTVVVIAME